MQNVFDLTPRHTVNEANINFYAQPFVHPKRKMRQHDFIYVLEGKWKIGQNDEEFELKKDSLLILFANQTHYGISHCEAGTKTMYFHLSFEMGDGENAQADQNKFTCESLIDASQNPEIKKLFKETVNAKLLGENLKANSYADLLIMELAKPGLVSGEDTALKIQKIIHANPERFYSNAQLAEKAGVSIKTAENKFKNRFGSTIHQYILNFKIKQAIALFSEFPQMQIKEIAYNLGFYDEYHFSKQFKKLTNLSPSQFKNENK